jgi:hypothetical protein
MRKTNSKSNGKTGGKGGETRNSGAARERWNEQVVQLVHRDGLSREKARDHVIMQELRVGEAGALAAMLLEGHVPSPNVRFALALMLLDNPQAEAAMASHHADTTSLWLPHRFAIKPRPAQPRLAREGLAHEDRAGESRAPNKSAPVMHDLGYEAAIARLDQAVLGTDARKPAGPAPPAPPKRRK